MKISGILSFRGTVALAMICAFASLTAAQQTPQPAAPTVSSKAAGKTMTKPRQPSGPRWDDLSSSQQKALEPLSGAWSQLSEAHKRKWLAVARNFHTLSENERRKLQERMVDWATLSAQERSRARQNFAVANRLSTDDRKAQWEAYQALSAEEKKRLAAKAYQPRGAAPAIRPVAAQKLAIVPITPGNPANPPKIVVPTAAAGDRAAPHPVEHVDAPAVPAAVTAVEAQPAPEPAVELSPN